MAGSLVFLTIIEGIETIVPVLLLAYASYWGLSIRRALALPLYRNQALGMGLVSATFGLLILTVFAPLSNGQSFAWILIPLVSAVTFYWADASVLASRRTDPLLRDTLHWKRVRIGLWIGLSVLIMVYYAAVIYDFATGVFSPFLYVDPFILIIAFVSAIVTLPIVSRRSKDTSLRRHLKWFALFGVCILVGFLVGDVVISLVFFGGNAPLIIAFAPQSAGITIGAYCLYRSAKSLVPLNRISLEEVTTKGDS